MNDRYATVASIVTFIHCGQVVLSEARACNVYIQIKDMNGPMN